MVKTIRTAAALLALFSFITGVVYPLAVAGIAHLFFFEQANGSIVMKDGKQVGSNLIGQQFDSPKFFCGRPSATSPYPYNPASSSGSNMGPNNPAFLETAQARMVRMKAANHMDDIPVPVDLVTSSGSGLDPHISPAAAEYQIKRIALARGLNESDIRTLVAENTENRQFGILGEPRVNVLRLNVALDELK